MKPVLLYILGLGTLVHYFHINVLINNVDNYLSHINGVSGIKIVWIILKVFWSLALARLVIERTLSVQSSNQRNWWSF